MESHIAVELLKSLDENELKEFSDFIHSPFFNKSEVLIRLFKILEKTSPDYSASVLKKERLYKKLYPGKNYHEQSIRNRMTELSSLLKEFYSIKSFRKDEMLRKKSFIKELRKKEKFTLAEKQINEVVKKLNDENNFHEVYFKNMMELLYESSKICIGKDDRAEKYEVSYRMLENELNYFCLNMLTTYNDVILYEIEQKEAPEFNFAKNFLEAFDFEKYLNALKREKYKHYPLIAIHYYGNIAIENPSDEKNYRKLKELIFKHYDKFQVMQIYNFWSLLSNSLFMLYQKKGSHFVNEAHEVNVFFLNKKLYPQDRPFPASAYQNTVVNAVMTGELEWAEKFAEEFKDKLSPEAMNNRYNYSKAMILFEKKDYNNSINHLSKINNDTWFFKINTRIFYLRNYYELGMSEQVISLLDSFRHFISNNPEIIPEYLEEKIKDSLDIIGKITIAKFGGKKMDYADYKRTLSIDTLLHKEWIIRKMEELM